MCSFKIRKINSHTYTVQVSSWVLGMQLFNAPEFTEVSDKEHVYEYKVTRRESIYPDAGERKFFKLLKANGLKLERY